MSRPLQGTESRATHWPSELKDQPMLTVAIVATLSATALAIATAVAYHIEAGDARRQRAVTRLRAEHLRRRRF